ncbi:MAG: regulatory protein NosR [Rhodospirillales bacterium]|nr:regulatory protein NosR [Rhodospirillales bacterium]
MEALRIFPRVLVLLAWLIAAAPIGAQAQTGLASFLDQIRIDEIFPGADRVGEVEGKPPAAPVFAGQELVGYLFLNSEILGAIGYSGKPIHVAVAIDLEGTIVGARLLAHSEPIVLIGIPEKRMTEFIQGYVGRNVLTEPLVGRAPPVDIVSGATVTVLVIGDTITRAAVRVARARGLGTAGAAPAPEAAPRRGIDMTREGTQSWEELVGDGSVRRLHLTVGEVNEAFANLGPSAPPPDPADPASTFIDLYVAQVSVPVIGRSLLGRNHYEGLQRRLGENQHAILVMGTGPYSWRGSGYVRGGIFDRVELQQDVTAVRFRDRDYRRLGRLAAPDAPQFPEIGLFVLPSGVEFEPAQAWQLQLLVQRAVGALEKQFITFALPYQVPDKYLLPAPAAAPAAARPAPAAAEPAPAEEAEVQPLWQRIWEDRVPDLAILAVGLLLLTWIFFFQDWLVKRQRLQYWLRFAFLAWTLLWLGWYALAQLSVVNVLTITNALITGFSWDYFLMDPLLFVLWAAVAASLLFWARGAFCGWLCPFGALQEFANRLARWARIPQVTVPWWLHERLWPIKYVIFLGLFGFALYSLTIAERLSEVEPFKTAIVLHFMRAWPFVAYAGLLLVVGLFIERFFCRYICPLGGALAIPARIRMFEWLKRYRECGNPCQRCANECPVASIHPDGRINPNECIYCMHCQLLYWDDQKCPVMIQKRLRRERAAALASPRTSKVAEPAMSPANPAGWETRDPATGSPPSPPRD